MDSHEKPFARNGNGPTLAENAIENRLRSATPMTPEEVAKLKEINNPGKRLL